MRKKDTGKKDVIVEDIGRWLLTVKQFSRFSDLTVETLRYYDELGVFPPDKHGTGYKSQYRYYTPSQIIAVKMIRVLTRIGVTLKTVKEIKQTRTPQKIAKLLKDTRIKIADNISFLQDADSKIGVLLDLIHEGMDVDEKEIAVCDMYERRLEMGGINDFKDFPDFYNPYIRFCETPNIDLDYSIGGYFESIAAFFDHPSQPARFFSLNPNGSGAQSAGRYLVGYTRGYYGQTNDLPERMAAYAGKNGIVFNGPVYQVYLHDEISIADPTRYLLQVSASVSEKRRVQPSRTTRRVIK